jgi:GNAT superfamily N-acetyltransferase
MQTKEINLAYERMSETDIPELALVMKRAFDDDSQKHLGQPEGGPEGYDNGDFFRKWVFGKAGGIGWKIVVNGKIVGAFIVWILPDRNNILGNIFVDPAKQDLGIGTQVWKFIEATYPETVSWQLDTPTWAKKNHHFYEKLGFVREKVEGDDVHYRKLMK